MDNTVTEDRRVEERRLEDRRAREELRCRKYKLKEAYQRWRWKNEERLNVKRRAKYMKELQNPTKDSVRRWVEYQYRNIRKLTRDLI